jgi:hypothetical protein
MCRTPVTPRFSHQLELFDSGVALALLLAAVENE